MRFAIVILCCSARNVDVNASALVGKTRSRSEGSSCRHSLTSFSSPRPKRTLISSISLTILKMLYTLRHLASISSGKNLRGTGKPVLSLEQVRTFLPILALPRSNQIAQFLQRQKVMSLWRDIVRATNSARSSSPTTKVLSDRDAEIPMPATRTEMRDFARDEFERFRHIEDIVSSKIPLLCAPICC